MKHNAAEGEGESAGTQKHRSEVWERDQASSLYRLRGAKGQPDLAWCSQIKNRKNPEKTLQDQRNLPPKQTTVEPEKLFLPVSSAVGKPVCLKCWGRTGTAAELQHEADTVYVPVTIGCVGWRFWTQRSSLEIIPPQSSDPERYHLPTEKYQEMGMKIVNYVRLPGEGAF